MTPTLDDWTWFLGSGKGTKAKRMKGSKEYTEAEFELEQVKKLEVLVQEADDDPWRPVWAWTLCETEETGIRRSWMSGRILADGECMIHLEGNLNRGIHVSEVPAEAWHWILGQPHGGDGRIMGALKSKYTREAKKAMADE